MYGHNFYEDRDRATRHSAEIVLSLVLARLGINSATDVGCGVGTWLSVLAQKGVTNICGFDGPWVEQELLVIPKESFRQADLEKPLRIERRYDLAISLEVAEHVSPANAKTFVSSLCALSDNVLFSAAIPYQGGTGHVNEQWLHYWVDLFAARGYGCQDFIRPLIWTDTAIPFWYRQNIVFFAKGAPHTRPLDLVHPDIYLMRAMPKLPPPTTTGKRARLKALLFAIRGR
jgi:cyclopropane fatty-acyl-phospholipid synthase-like methyltransferase